jgi:hypothetical protein
MKPFAITTTIRATPQAIWDIITDAASYPAWNTTVSSVDGRIAPGETVTVHAKIAPGRAFPVKVVAFEPPRRMTWRSGMPFGLFSGERVFELSEGAGSVEFTMREEYTGALAPLITKSIPDLQPAFAEFAACLKARAENA